MRPLLRKTERESVLRFVHFRMGTKRAQKLTTGRTWGKRSPTLVKRNAHFALWNTKSQWQSEACYEIRTRLASGRRCLPPFRAFLAVAYCAGCPPGWAPNDRHFAGRPGVSTVATNFTGWVVVLYLYGATAYRFHMEVNCASFSSACFDKFVPFVEIQSGFQPDDSRSP